MFIICLLYAYYMLYVRIYVSIICIGIVYLSCIFSKFIICLLHVIYVQSTYMLCYVILCYAMVGSCAVSCLKNFSAQSDSVLFCASVHDNKRLELELYV